MYCWRLQRRNFFKYFLCQSPYVLTGFFLVSACETRQKNFDDIFLYIVLRKRMKFPNKFHFACYHRKNIHLVLLYGSFQVSIDAFLKRSSMHTSLYLYNKKMSHYESHSFPNFPQTWQILIVHISIFT